MLWYNFVWALALLGLTNAARRGSSLHRHSRRLSNADRVQRGLPLNNPTTLYDPTRTRALVPRASVANDNTYNIALQPVTFSRKRSTEMYYLTVQGGIPMATDDPSKASDFIIPDGIANKDLIWVPNAAEVLSQSLTPGTSFSLFADALTSSSTSGIYNLRFGTSPNTPSSLSSFFALPPFASGFSPVLDSGAEHPHVFLWAMDTSGDISFVQDAAVLRTQSLNSKVMVAQAVRRNAVPTTADALAALQHQLVIPAKLYVLAANGTTSGYVSVSTDDNSLEIGPNGATFFAPGLTTGQVAHTLTTQINGLTGKVFQADSAISGAINATSLAVTTEATTDVIKFVLPSTGSGIVKVAGYGIGNWEVYAANGKIFSCASSTDCYAKYRAQPLCAELVSPGAEPSACATLFANGVPTALLPVIPSTTDTSGIGNLDPTTSGNSTYTENGVTDATIQHLFAVVEANYSYPTVILPEISSVSDVDCAPNGLLIKFNNTRAYNYAVERWTPYNNGTGFLLVTDTLACSTADVGQRGYWLVNSMTFDNSSKIIYVDADEIGVSDAFNNIHVIWGTHVPVDAKPTPDITINGTMLLGPDTANSTVNMYTQYTSLTCVNPPASYLGLPAAACGPDFDLILDAKLGTINVNDVAAMNRFSPNLGDMIALSKSIGEATGGAYGLPPTKRALKDLRGRRIAKRGFFKNLWNGVKAVVNKVVDIAGDIRRAAEDLARRVAEQARQLAERVAAEARRIAAEVAARAAAAAEALKRAAEAALRAKVNMKTPTAEIPIAVRPGGYFAEAFGTDQALVIWETSVERTFGGEKENAGKESGGGTETESKVTAEIGLYCVDCGVTGTARLQGELEYTLLPPQLKTIGVNVNGDLLAQVNLGLIAEVGYAYSIEKELWSQPIPSAGIKIGNFLTVGVAVTVAAKAEFEISAQGEVIAGLAARWDDINVHVNLVNPRDNRMSGFDPKWEHKFEAAGQISATMGLGLPVTIGVGVNIPPLQFNKQIGVVNTPKVEAEIKYTSTGIAEPEEDQCGIGGGLGWSVTASDKLSLDLLGNEIELATLAEKELAGGCIKANGGTPAVISVPTKALPPPPPAPVFPASECGLPSTGRVPWAIYDNLDIDGTAPPHTQVASRDACHSKCQADRTCVATTFNENTNMCAIVSDIYYYKAPYYKVSIRGETCVSNAQNVPAALGTRTGCCTQYRT